MSVSIKVSDHAMREASRRGIDEAIIRNVAQAPEQVLPVRPGREVRQARISFPPDGAVYLVRVFVDVGLGGDVVVTVYRTSKIEKYWRLQ
jgi:hypothetical protein